MISHIFMWVVLLIHDPISAQNKLIKEVPEGHVSFPQIIMKLEEKVHPMTQCKVAKLLPLQSL